MDERKLTLRNRIIGVLLRHNRQHDGRTKAECAEVLGVSASTIDAYEEGREPVSLPELEVLGYLTNTPINRFLEREGDLKRKADEPDFQATMTLRNRIIGVLLRQARLEADITKEELAEVLDCSPRRIANYEEGEQAVPVAELELLAEHLGLSLEDFLDGDGTVAGWHRQQEIDRDFHELPADIQAFVTKPINIKYLEVAMRLSRMPASKLRGIAEGLLEITY